MTLQDQEDRVLLMAQNSPTWDLSTNDREALAAVLEALTTERRDHQHWLAEAKLAADRADGAEQAMFAAGEKYGRDHSKLDARVHRSDCATHNEPAEPIGPCDCGGK